jgi:hypothetical protein
MSFWSRPSTTTGLLGVIALLLLVLVIQNATKGPGPLPPPMSPHAMSGQVPGGMPESEPGQMPAGHPPIGGMGGTSPEAQNFDPALMVMAAMKCPSDATLTLDAQACSGGEADSRRDFIRGVQGREQSIRGVFDAIVKKFGMDALTEQAQQIRRMRKP